MDLHNVIRQADVKHVKHTVLESDFVPARMNRNVTFFGNKVAMLSESEKGVYIQELGTYPNGFLAVRRFEGSHHIEELATNGTRLYANTTEGLMFQRYNAALVETIPGQLELVNYGELPLSLQRIFSNTNPIGERSIMPISLTTGIENANYIPLDWDAAVLHLMDRGYSNSDHRIRSRDGYVEYIGKSTFVGSPDTRVYIGSAGVHLPESRIGRQLERNAQKERDWTNLIDVNQADGKLPFEVEVSDSFEKPRGSFIPVDLLNTPRMDDHLKGREKRVYTQGDLVHVLYEPVRARPSFTIGAFARSYGREKLVRPMEMSTYQLSPTEEWPEPAKLEYAHASSRGGVIVDG